VTSFIFTTTQKSSSFSSYPGLIIIDIALQPVPRQAVDSAFINPQLQSGSRAVSDRLARADVGGKLVATRAERTVLAARLQLVAVDPNHGARHPLVTGVPGKLAMN